MRVKFGDLKINDEARSNVIKALDDNWISEGQFVQQFEDEWTRLFGYYNSAAMSSGTDACINACLALYDFGASRGDEVICPALTFSATVNSILAAGFQPVFVDINKNTLNIDEKAIEAVITPKTKAIFVVHLMGKPCEMSTIKAIADAHGLYVLEDACEAHGAKYKDQYIGHWGHVAAFSFYTAHIVVAGEGGMCSTDYSDWAESLRSTRSHGRKPGTKYFDFQRLGLNSRMNDLTAAIGVTGVKQFHDIINRRVEIRGRFLEGLSNLEDKLWLQRPEDYEFISPHAFPVVLRNDDLNLRDKLYGYLEMNGVECKTLFGSLPTQHRCFRFLGYHLGDFPDAEYVGRNGLHFGLNQHISDSDVEYTIELIRRFFSETV